MYYVFLQMPRKEDPGKKNLVSDWYANLPLLADKLTKISQPFMTVFS